MLGAVLLACLIEAGDAGLDTEQAAKQSERDYDRDSERLEVVAALGLLVEHDLASHDGERWRATRAALATRIFSF